MPETAMRRSGVIDPEPADPVTRQRRYYEASAGHYDAAHLARGSDDEHVVALRFMAGFLQQLGCRTVLDVGSGTGRVAGFLRDAAPTLAVTSVEPVVGLLREGFRAGRYRPGSVVRADGAALPFPDRAFDAVIETAVLHHVERPERVVAEMLRVARRAVCLSDSNRFGQGALPLRLAKLGLYRAGLWPLARRLRRGRLYTVSDGDGLAYSYSVFDSLPLLATQAARVLAVPTAGGWGACQCPLLLAPQVCLCAELAPPGAGGES